MTPRAATREVSDMIGEHVMNKVPHPTIYNSPVFYWFVRLALLWAFVAAIAWGVI